MFTKCKQCHARVILLHVEKYIIIRVRGVYISVLEHCRKMNFRTFLNLILISNFFMLSRLSDFCGVRYKSLFGVVGSISKVKT